MQKIGKEVKIGLAVIGVLLVAFGYVLVKRLSRPNDSTVASEQAAEPADAAATAARPAIEKPTVIAATDSERPGDPTGRDSARSRWTLGGRDGEASVGKNSEPASNVKNSFAAAPREADSPEAHSGSFFGRNDAQADAPNRLPESARRLGPRDDRDHDPATVGGAVQTSDTAPAATVSNPSVPLGSQSIFAKSAAEKAAGDKVADDKASGRFGPDRSAAPDPFQRRPADSATAAAPAADAFNRRSADAAPPSDPFNRRPADLATGADAFHAKVADSTLDARNDAGKSFADRRPAESNSLAPVESRPLKPTSAGDNSADSRNPLRNISDTDARPTGGPADSAAGRFPSANRFNAIDAAPANSVMPAREANASAPARMLDSGSGNIATQPLVGDDVPKPGQYIVQPNDNYWTISKTVYGDGGFFKAIYEHNRRQHPKAERLQVGEVLYVPDAATLQKLYPDLCPKPGRIAAPQRTMPASARIRPGTKVYVVEEGDTLFKIAKDQLGNPSRWGEVYQLNRELLGKDYDYLKPGTELLIPASESRPDPIARQPGGTVNQ
jgi:nucleoid-associated protein YgaU